MKVTLVIRRAALGVAAAATVASLVACSGADGGAEGGSAAQTVEISLSTPYAEALPVAEPFKAFAENVQEGSDGQMSVEVFWGGALSPFAEALQAVGSGLADVSPLGVTYYPLELERPNWAAPLASLSDSPSLFAPMLTGSVAMLSMMQDPLFQAETEAAGIVVLGVFVTDPNVLICNKPVTSLADAQGLITRSAGEMHSVQLEALNMSPSSLPFTEAYEALQRGVIDCTMLPTGPAADFGIYDVAPHIVDARLTGGLNWLVIN